jgi:signal transduction histidine kinase
MLDTTGCTRKEAALGNLYRIIEAMNAPSSLDEILGLIIESLLQLTDADRGCLVLFDKSERPEVKAARNFELQSYEAFALEPGFQLVQEVLQKRHPLIAGGPRSESDCALQPCSVACLPVNIGGEVSGVLYLDSREPGAFSREELPLLMAFAGQAAIAIENSRLREKSLQADRARSELVAYIAHKLSTPLTSIRGYAEMLEKGVAGSLTPEQTTFFRSVVRNVERMQELISKLQDISRIESGQLRLMVQPTAFGEILERALGVLRGEIEAQSQRLILEVAAELPMVEADPARLEQILNYLLDNASRYTPKGGQITVRAWAQGGHVYCAITDTGIGISQEDQAHLFTRFFRSQNPVVREKFGVGLGLCIARHLVEMQGGAIWVASRAGEGTTVTFTVPVAVPLTAHFCSE